MITPIILDGELPLGLCMRCKTNVNVVKSGWGRYKPKCSGAEPECIDRPCLDTGEDFGPLLETYDNYGFSVLVRDLFAYFSCPDNVVFGVRSNPPRKPSRQLVRILFINKTLLQTSTQLTCECIFIRKLGDNKK
jgi:hypothetical protein